MDNDNIYENMMKNSIGSDKRTTNKFTKRKAILNIALSTLLSAILAASLAGCGKSTAEEKEIIQQEYAQIYEDYGVSALEIQAYELDRVNGLLEDSGLNDYSLNDEGLRDYNYSSDDYGAIEGLDESYLYAFYGIASDEDVDEMAKGLGYEGLNGYLEANGFVYQDGKMDGRTWAAYDSVTIAKIMNAEQNNKGMSK